MTFLQGALITFAMVLLNFIIYYFFGLLVTVPAKLSKNPCLSILAGFFLYYSLFSFFAVYLTYRWRPLSMLSALWGSAVIVILLLSLGIFFKKIPVRLFRSVFYTRKSYKMLLACLFLLIIQLFIILYSYQFTLDAAYYVANVTTTVRTNSLNIYDPYTGDWQDHFEMRYFFATYNLQDAVMCSLFKIPALIQTKLIMASICLILTNMLYYLIGKELFPGDKRKFIPLMVFFAGLINFFFTTIYTSSTFLTTRTYEGKSILGNVILPALLLYYIKAVKEDRVRWGQIFLICFGSCTISNTSNMLVPAALLILFVPYIAMKIKKKQPRAAFKNALGLLLCMLPGLILSLVYVAYVKGMFVLYTYPR